MHIDTATRPEMECAILADDELLNYLGGLDKIQAMTTEELRENITNWIEEGSEV